MQTRSIGPVTVSAIGLGGMPMSIEGRPDEAHGRCRNNTNGPRGKGDGSR
jgi:aryl-alcohol dehydrogenase-like predicted oxidoreductase